MMALVCKARLLSSPDVVKRIAVDRTWDWPTLLQELMVRFPGTSITRVCDVDGVLLECVADIQPGETLVCDGVVEAATGPEPSVRDVMVTTTLCPSLPRVQLQGC